MRRREKTTTPPFFVDESAGFRSEGNVEAALFFRLANRRPPGRFTRIHATARRRVPSLPLAVVRMLPERRRRSADSGALPAHENGG